MPPDQTLDGRGQTPGNESDWQEKRSSMQNPVALGVASSVSPAKGGIAHTPSLLIRPGKKESLMKANSPSDREILPILTHETLYVGVDIGKTTHVAGFLSPTLLDRHRRFEHCPALSFENSREGFRALIDRIRTYVPLTQVQVVLEVTGHYHRALLQYLQEQDIAVYIMHVQKRQEELLKSDKRDALGLANMLYNQLEKGIQVGDPLQAVRRLIAPTEAAAQLRGVVRHHYELVAESTERKNKLTAICDELFPELTRLLRNPNLPTALALCERFPTPADLAAATFWELRAARGRTCSVSDAKLQELQRLAVQTIGTKDPARVRGLVIEQKQLIRELNVIAEHLAQLETEMAQVVANCREGVILTSILHPWHWAASGCHADSHDWQYCQFRARFPVEVLCRLGSKGSSVGFQPGLDQPIAAWSQTNETGHVSHCVESDPMGCGVEGDV